MLSEDRQNIIPNDNLSEEEFNQLFSIVSAMDEIGLSRFSRIPPDFDFPTAFEEVFGLQSNGQEPNDDREYLSYQLASPVIFLPFLTDKDYVIYVQSLNELIDAGQGEGYEFASYTLTYLEQPLLKQYQLSLIEDIELWQANLYDIAKTLQATFETDFYLSTNVEEMITDYVLETMDIQIVVLSLNTSASQQRPQLNNLSMEFYLTIKLK
jgi:hypothetical protein